MSSKIVTQWDQVAVNLRHLEAVAKLPRSDARRVEYGNLIRRGSCFLAYPTREGIAFAPSRFIGYVGNDVMKHATRRGHTDGKKTNPALDQIVEEKHKESSAFEREYQAFCARRGIVPHQKGTGGSARKYWISRISSELLERLESNAIEADASLDNTERVQLQKSRIGQGVFKLRQLKFWGNCCLTDCAIKRILKASHIKPWCASDNFERLDKFNGLLLSPNADALFDCGLISFDNRGALLISSKISVASIKSLLGKHRDRIAIQARHKPYLEYHRNYQFKQ